MNEYIMLVGITLLFAGFILGVIIGIIITKLVQLAERSEAIK